MWIGYWKRYSLSPCEVLQWFVMEICTWNVQAFNVNCVNKELLQPSAATTKFNVNRVNNVNFSLFIKGGETIRQINQSSGAHVELNRSIPENGPTRLFTIRGLCWVHILDCSNCKICNLANQTLLLPSSRKHAWGGKQNKVCSKYLSGLTFQYLPQALINKFSKHRIWSARRLGTV